MKLKNITPLDGHIMADMEKDNKLIPIIFLNQYTSIFDVYGNEPSKILDESYLKAQEYVLCDGSENLSSIDEQPDGTPYETVINASELMLYDDLGGYYAPSKAGWVRVELD
jgi:hypothetical protein